MDVYIEGMKAIAPELVLTALCLVVLVVDLVMKGRNSKVVGYLTIAGLAVVGMMLAMRVGDEPRTVFGMVEVDSFGTYFKLFTVAAVALRIARPAVLARYAQKFEDRCHRYHRAWHLCVRADDRCRAEFWLSERRRQARFSEAHPNLTSVDQVMPWDTVIREAADNLEFWLSELQEPAMLYTQARDESAAPPPALGDAPRIRNNGTKGKGGHPRRRGGRFISDGNGTEICNKFNWRDCDRGCGRAHICSVCLGEHPSADCTRVKKGKGGKGAKKSAAAASSS